MRGQLLTEKGYAALGQLALDQPTLFLKPDRERLKNAMVSAAKSEAVWGEPIELRQPCLDEINRIRKPGPARDAADAERLEHAIVGELTDSAAAKPRLWATLNCFHLARYVPIRWKLGRATHKNLGRYVEVHWLKRDWRANAAQRLWGLRLISRRAAKFARHHDQKALCEAMAGKVNLYHQVLSRPVLASNARVLAAIYEVALSPGNEHLFQTKDANRFIKTLMQRAAALALDVMPKSELLRVVGEAVPPKER